MIFKIDTRMVRGIPQRDFKCSECDRAFTQREMVGFHKLVVHRNQIRTPEIPEIPDNWKPFFKQKNIKDKETEKNDAEQTSEPKIEAESKNKIESTEDEKTKEESTFKTEPSSTSNSICKAKTDEDSDSKEDNENDTFLTSVVASSTEIPSEESKVVDQPKQNDKEKKVSKKIRPKKSLDSDETLLTLEDKIKKNISDQVSIMAADSEYQPEIQHLQAEATTQEVSSPKTFRIQNKSLVGPESKQIGERHKLKLSAETIAESSNAKSSKESVPENVASITQERKRKRKRSSNPEMSNSDLDSKRQKIDETEKVDKSKVNLQPVVILKRIRFISEKSSGNGNECFKGRKPEVVEQSYPPTLSQESKGKDDLETIQNVGELSSTQLTTDSPMKPMCTFCEKSFYDVHNLKRHIKLRCPVVKKLNAEKK